MSPRAAFGSVAEYLASLSPEQARALKRILTVVQKSTPGCTRVISYNIPGFKLERVFIFCAAFKGHIGIYPPVRADVGLRLAVKHYANAKGNLRFPLDEPMPYALIAKVAKALAKQSFGFPRARQGSKGKPKSGREA